jgi:hypothetical protein
MLSRVPSAAFALLVVDAVRYESDSSLEIIQKR